MQFFRMMSSAFRRCGDVFPLKKVINMYIDGLISTIYALVLRSRDTNEECTYLEVVQKANSEGDALRARAAFPFRRSVST